MDNATIFYICGGVLAVSAVLLSFAGLRIERFPGRMAPLVVLWFVALVAAATTFGVLNGKDEDEARAAELEHANQEFAEEEGASHAETRAAEGSGEAKPEAGGEKSKVEAAPKEPGGTLQLAADPTEIAYDTSTLTSKPGEVTIDFSNPATLEHDVAIEQGGEQIAISETIAKGKTSVSADLAPGTYTFLCTVPGHAEAGMEGTLTVE